MCAVFERPGAEPSRAELSWARLVTDWQSGLFFLSQSILGCFCFSSESFCSGRPNLPKLLGFLPAVRFNEVLMPFVFSVGSSVFFFLFSLFLFSALHYEPTLTGCFTPAPVTDYFSHFWVWTLWISCGVKLFRSRFSLWVFFGVCIKWAKIN